MDIGCVLKDIFEEECKVLKQLQAGLRCKTYLIENKGNKYIFQIYKDNTIYQAEKKYKILNMFDEKYIPKAYKYGVYDTYSYLVTEYKNGDSVNNIYSNNEKFSLTEISDELAYTLFKIHSIKKENVFGWITDKDIIENKKLSDYINSEYERLLGNLYNIEDSIKCNILNKAKQSIKIIEEKSKDKRTSCLCWYDINPDNILVSKKDNRYNLEGVIDPGGARFGIEEWDLAFIKMELCKNKKEFINLLNFYSKYNKTEIDMELLEALTVFVELDDMTVRILDKIALPIPYESNFSEEIKLVEKLYHIE